ncbi:putative oxidoreductase C19A8.06 [Phytophthora nicotianae]|uniref:Oxidoreductase C19A8.06 n=1 Tax=Phytophthora nicotianae TaxID=4792 RepID=A0A0W8D3T6_PHYNI|nr:putative oxidoreductase C19A8.06 [Phytophthora nicotianae]
MGDQQDASPSSDKRNPTSPAPMSGIDWSIFKDGEEDAFGWLLRNNAATSATTSDRLAASSSENAESDILPLDDIEMDRMMAGTQHMMTKGQAVDAATAAGATESNARLLATQLYEGLRPSQSASFMSMLPNTRPFDIRDDLNHTLSIVKKLEEVTDEKNTALETQVAQLQQILTPSQATKFIIWVKENPAFMYMLDKLVDSTLQNNTGSIEE